MFVAPICLKLINHIISMGKVPSKELNHKLVNLNMLTEDV